MVFDLKEVFGLDEGVIVDWELVFFVCTVICDCESVCFKGILCFHFFSNEHSLI